jgi:CubicO group peptidase (beta-lactamase class C family)
MAAAAHASVTQVRPPTSSLSAARSAPITDFLTKLDALVAVSMTEWKIPDLAIAVVQNGAVALLKAYQGRTFVIAELAGFRVEFHRSADGTVDEIIFHQPNGTFPAQRV